LPREALDGKNHRQRREYPGWGVCFPGNSRSFKVLTDYLEGGDTLDQFLEQYPTVTRELAIAALEEARLSLVANL
jgi:hypothetical protein